MTPRSPILRTASAVLAALALAACADGGVLPAGPSAPEAPPAPEGLTVRCAADVRGGTLRCGDDALPGIAASRNIGGQGVYVRLTSSNVSYDARSGAFEADVTVQNLLVQRLGTPDGVTTTGIRVFFHQEPASTDGPGVVSVANADGEGLFTGSAQPYFSYPQALSRMDVSAPRRWRFQVPPSVLHFTFTVYVNAEVLPVVVFDQTVPGAGREVVRIGLDGGDRVAISNDPSEDRDPTVEGGRVVWAGFRHGNAELYAAPLTGEGPITRLTNTALAESEPALSRGGRFLAYVYPVAGVGKVFTMNADGTGAARRFPGWGFDGAPEASPDWFPDTASTAPLLFTSTANGSADLYRGSTTAGIQPLVTHAKADVEGAWSPDGRRVVFVSNRSPDEDTDLYLLTVGTGAVTRLTDRAGSDSGPTWISDTRIVFVASEGSASRLRTLDVTNPSVVRDIPNTAGARRPAGVRF